VSGTVVPKSAEEPERVSVACTFSATPKATTAVAVLVSVPINTVAVTVKLAADEIEVGVPEMVPVASSKISPAGSVPEIA
jgi:hypothetical protein